MKTNLITDSLSNSSNIGYTPNQVRTAYTLSQRSRGEGVSVAVIDFLGNIYLQNNLDIFSNEFGLPRIQLQFIGETPRNSRFDFSAYIEPSADTQWVHAISPRAQLKVIRATQYSIEGAMEAIKQALEQNCDIILQTFQAPFDESYVKYESIYSSNAVFVSSAGDYGAGAFFPSCFTTCISVGGTSLQLNLNGNRISEETVWNGTGGGICTYFEIPDYQKKFYDIESQTSGHRGVPDISFLADPNTGYSVYHSSVSDSFGWYKAGGTSIGASVVAGILANMLSYTNINDKRSVLPMLYSLAGEYSYKNEYNKFKDITTGGNNMFQARVGYDLCTGLGSLINL